MSGDGPAPAKRPWWVPLLAVGSMGMGGMQAVGGMAILAAGTQLKGASATALFVAGLAWLLPGAVLVLSGIGVIAGARWARTACLLSVAAWALGSGVVAMRRATLPPAMADLMALAKTERGSSSMIPELLKVAGNASGGDPEQQLRNPEQREVQEWVFAGECCCPALPWQVFLLIVWATPMGRRMTMTEPGTD